jgi:hypothetical protein
MTFEVSGRGTAWSPDVVIEPGTTTDVGELVLDSSVVTGRVVTPDGESVPGAIVVLETMWRNGERGTTDPEGAFAFRDLPAGLYWLHAQAPDGARKLDVVTLAPGEERELLVELEPPAALRVVVLRRGEPAGCADVRLHHDARFRARTTTPASCDAGGRARFAPLEPGGYEIEAGPVRHRVELAPGDDREVALELELDGAEIWVLAEDGAPARLLGAELHVLARDHARAGEVLAAEVLGEGRLRVALVDGPALLLARVASDEGSWEAALALEGNGVPEPVLRLPAGTLEVAMAPDARGSPPPRLSLHSVGDRALDAPMPLELLRERTESGWLFRGVATDAALLLSGVDARGNALLRLSPASPTPRLERWP